MYRTVVSTLAFILLAALPSAGQSYTISTIAGKGRIVFSSDGGSALNSRLLQPEYVAVDGAGNIYVSDSYYNQVFRIALDGTISVFAGNGGSGFSGDGGPARSASLYGPLGLAFDSSGNLYIADNLDWRIRVVTPDGVISTFAGNGTAGFGGNGGPATSASIQNPSGLAFDSAGNLYISQPFNNVIRKVDTSGNISVFAGTGAAGYSGDGKAATAATLFSPAALAVDSNGAVYFADQNTRIRKVGLDGIISAFAGSNQIALGDGGAAIDASLVFPEGLVFLPDGSLYVADSGHFLVRAILTNGRINTVAGGGGTIADGAAVQAYLPFPVGLAVDSQGNVVVAANSGRQVRLISPSGSIATIAGVFPTIFQTDGLPATSVSLLNVWGIAADGAGNVFVSDDTDSRIQKIAPDGTIFTFAGDSLVGSPPDGRVATVLGSPWGLSFDVDGTLLVGAGSGETVFRLAADATSTRVAGGNGIAWNGDGALATLASIGTPVGVVADPINGGFFIADSVNNVVRRVNAKGIISTYVGTGHPGYTGDNGLASAATLNGPQQLALDSNGNLYIADSLNNVVRMVATSGVITTVAGTGTAGISGDGGPAVSAQLYFPLGVAVDSTGNLYIAEANRIRMVNSATGSIATIAGSAAGFAGFGGDGGPANQALLFSPSHLALDSNGNLYIADRGNYRVRMLMPAQ